MVEKVVQSELSATAFVSYRITLEQLKSCGRTDGQTDKQYYIDEKEDCE